jgi:hypothetical protein
MAQPPASNFQGVTTRSAVNVEPADVWTNDNPWIDLCKRSQAWFGVQGATVRQDGWLQDLQPGGTASFWTHLDQDPWFGFIPTGPYVAKNSQGVTMDFLGAAAGDKVASATRATCTVRDSAHPPTQGDFGMRITNNTSGVIRLFDTLRIFRARDEKALDAGAIWRPEKVASLGNAAVVRTMTLLSPNLGGADRYQLDQPGFLAKASDRSFSESYHVPYGACANLAATAGRDLWITFPYCVDNLKYELDAAANRVYPLRTRVAAGRFSHGWAEGTQLCFPTEGQFTAETGIPSDRFVYIRNVEAQGFQLSTTRSGPVDVRIRMTTGKDKPYSYVAFTRVFTQPQLLDYYRQIAAQIKANYNSTGRIVVEAGNEPWNTGFGQFQFLRGYFSQLGGSYGAGTLQARLGGGNAYASLLAWKAMLEQFPRSRLVFVLNGQVAWWDLLGGAGGMFDYVDPGLVMPGRRMADIVDEYAVAPYTAPRHPGTGKTYTFAEFRADNAATQPDAWWTERFRAENTHLATDWMRTSVGNAREKNPAIRITTYETGQHIWDDVGTMTPEALAITRRAHQYLSGPAGAAMFQDHYQRVHKDFGLTLYNQFVDVGGWYSRRFINGGWGMRPHSDAPANAHFDWFNALPGKPASIGTAAGNVRALAVGGPPPDAEAARWTQSIAAGWEVSSHWENDAGKVPFTHLLLAGPVDLLASLQHGELVDDVLQQCEALVVHSPGAQPLLWHAWHPGAPPGLAPSTVQRFIRYELKMQKAWDALTARVNLAAVQRGHAWRLRNAPAAYCVARLVDHACNDQLPGISGVDTAATLAAIFGEEDCTGAPGTGVAGTYYVQCLRMAMLHRRSPLGAWHPPALTAEQAGSLQQVAWTALLDYHNWYAWTPTMAQARAYLSGDADLTALEHLGVRKWAPSFFRQTGPGSANPFAFDPDAG